MKRYILASCVLMAIALATATSGWAGAIFITGHDPDFHANNSTASDLTSARQFIQTAIGYVMDATVNTYVANGIDKFLVVESRKIRINPNHPNHRKGVVGIRQSGFQKDVDFEVHGANTLDAELDLLGTKYSAIVVTSDFGGTLSQPELDMLNAHKTAIKAFINGGGGLFAMAESNRGDHFTPDGGHFGFLPFAVSSTMLTSAQTNSIVHQVTAFGTSIGITEAMVASSSPHNYFNDTFGLDIVNQSTDGKILSLAGTGHYAPEPATIVLMGIALCGLLGLEYRRRKK